MRFYVKLGLILTLFAGLTSASARRMTSNLAYEIRVALVCAFGNDADYERLVESTRRMIAVQSDSLDAYLARDRFRQRLCITRDGPGKKVDRHRRIHHALRGRSGGSRHSLSA